MITVKQLLKTKSPNIWTIESKVTAYKALQLMSERQIGAVMVLEKGKLVGVFSERDYARKVILKGKSSKDTLVSELMSHPVCYVRPEQTIEDCMALMTAKRIRHLPVLENDQLIGIVTIGDVVKTIISEQKFTIQQLENYITGGGYGH